MATNDQRIGTRAQEIGSPASLGSERDVTVKQLAKQTYRPEPKKARMPCAGRAHGKLLPKYRVRSPIVYQILETELDSLTNFNDLALCWMSIGGFLTCVVISILVGYGYATTPIPAFGRFLLYNASWWIAALAVLCFIRSMGVAFKEIAHRED